jgi:hypothetical protein
MMGMGKSSKGCFFAFLQGVLPRWERDGDGDGDGGNGCGFLFSFFFFFFDCFVNGMGCKDKDEDEGRICESDPGLAIGDFLFSLIKKRTNEPPRVCL